MENREKDLLTETREQRLAREEKALRDARRQTTAANDTSAILSWLIPVALIGLLGYFLYTRYYSSKETPAATTEVAQTATPAATETSAQPAPAAQPEATPAAAPAAPTEAKA